MESARQKHSLYSQGVESYLQGNNRQLKSIINDPGLSQVEKNLLLTRLFVKKSEIYRAEKLLKATTTNQIPFLDAEKHFILANIESYKGDWTRALEMNVISNELYKKVADRRGLFITFYNLHVDLEKLGRIVEAEQNLEYCMPLTKESSEEVLVLRAKACFASKAKQYDLALQYINRAQRKEAERPNVDHSYLELIKGDILFRSGQHEQSFVLLQKLMNDKRIKEKGKIQFYYYLAGVYLNRIKLNKLSSPPKSLMETKEYYLKWQLVEMVSTGDLDQAKKMWNDLVELFPTQFKPEFLEGHETENDNALFMCLKKIAGGPKREIAVKGFTKKSKLTELFKMLSESPMPLRKEVIIEKLWGSYDPAFESKFYQLVARIKKRGVQINNFNRAYAIRH